MELPNLTDKELVQQIRCGGTAGDDAWWELIGRYEGRLLAFVSRRVSSRADAEDIVQETLLGLALSLCNFDEDRPLESYVFAIAANKLRDHLRKTGRRPRLFSLGSTGAGSPDGEGQVPPAKGRLVSSLARSRQRREMEEVALAQVCEAQIETWRSRGQWKRIMCVEMLFVRGRSNPEVALILGLTPEAVASIKHDFLVRLREAMRKFGLPREVFPELYES